MNVSVGNQPETILPILRGLNHSNEILPTAGYFKGQGRNANPIQCSIHQYIKVTAFKGDVLVGNGFIKPANGWNIV